MQTIEELKAESKAQVQRKARAAQEAPCSRNQWAKPKYFESD